MLRYNLLLIIISLIFLEASCQDSYPIQVGTLSGSLDVFDSSAEFVFEDDYWLSIYETEDYRIINKFTKHPILKNAGITDNLFCEISLVVPKTIDFLMKYSKEVNNSNSELVDKLWSGTWRQVPVLITLLKNKDDGNYFFTYEYAGKGG